MRNNSINLEETKKEAFALKSIQILLLRSLGL